MTSRVAVIGLASDFGCQVQITNAPELLAVLSQFDLAYWQLASSGHLHHDYDIAVIEGAVTTEEHVKLLKSVRETARKVIVIGACAISGGVPGLAATDDFESRVECVYGEDQTIVACGRVAPMPVDAIIDVDYHVPGCPIEPAEFVSVLQRALMGLSDKMPREPMCASCKVAENVCFYSLGQVCLGTVTRAGCGAKCVTLGRPCTGCRGIARDANLESARQVLVDNGMHAADFDRALQLYNAIGETRR